MWEFPRESLCGLDLPYPNVHVLSLFLIQISFSLIMQKLLSSWGVCVLFSAVPTILVIRRGLPTVWIWKKAILLIQPYLKNKVKEAQVDIEPHLILDAGLLQSSKISWAPPLLLIKRRIKITAYYIPLPFKLPY